MRCPSCSHEVPDEPFCQRCGKSLTAERTDPIKPKSAASLAFKVAALCMSLVIAVGAVRTPADAAIAATAASPDAASVNPTETAGTTPAAAKENRKNNSPDEASYKQATDKLTRLYAGLDVINAKIDRSLFEIDALADRLGADPATIFKFVRDEIRYEPYVGVLRGALGTLVCRAGNSLDRSLLLAALLQKAGLAVQISNGKLSDADAHALVLRVFEPMKPLPRAFPQLSDLAPDLSKALGGDQQQLLRIAAQNRTAAIARRDQLMAYVGSETDFLTSLLTKAGVDPTVLTPPDRLVAEAQDHYWVRYQDASGAWVDLDSAFGNSEPGRARTESTRNFDPGVVPEELYHHLRIVLTLRSSAGGGADDQSDQVLLDQELRIPDLQGRGVTLISGPAPRVDPLKRGATLAAVLDSARVYQTVLVIGDQLIPGKGFDLHGQVGAVSTPEGVDVEQAGGIGGANGGLWGGMGGATGGGSGAAPKGSGGNIVGEWVDYTLTSPGIFDSAPQVRAYHRDIVAPVTVTSWSADSPHEPRTTPTHFGLEALRHKLVWSEQLVPVAGTPGPDYAGYLRLQALIAGRPAFDAFNKALHGLPVDRAALNPPPQAMAAGVLLAESAMNSSGSGGGAAGASVRSYFDEPGLIAYEHAIDDSSGKLRRTEGFDIVTYSPRVTANSRIGAVDARHLAASLQIRRGVLATRLEAVLSAGASGSDAAVEHVANITNVFSAAQRQAIPIIVMKPGEAGTRQLASLAVPDAVKAELAQDLGAGQTVIIPARSATSPGQPQFGWWRWRADSGELIGVMPGERGQAMTEKVIIEYFEVLNSELCFLEAAQVWNGGGEDAAGEGIGKSIACAMGAGAEPGMIAMGFQEYSGTVMGIMFEFISIFVEHNKD
jgi:hypothetical protein